MDVTALGLSLRLAAWTTLLLLGLGLPLAWWLATSRWRWKFLVEAVVALPLVLPPTVLGFYLLLALGPRGALGPAFERLAGHSLLFSFAGLLLGSVLYSLPFAVQPFTAALAGVDPRLLEASWCLGVSRARTFVRVVLPLAAPGLLSGMVLTLRPHAGRVRRGAHGGRQPRGPHAHGLHLHLRLGAGAGLRGGGPHVARAAAALLRCAGAHVWAAAQGVDAMAPPLVVDLERRFGRGPTVRARLELPATPGRVAVLFGPSGAGKTTVLRCLAGLDRPESGRILFQGETWCDTATGVFLPPQRRRVGLLFQDYALFPHLSAEQNVQYGLAHLPAAERRERSRALFQMLRLEGLEHRGPRELSGGQQQRVALARALATRPRLLLLDEPLSALDAPAREGLRGELRRLLRELGMPTVVVTHDRLEALALGDDLVAMEGGRVCQVGPVADVFNHPVDLAVARMTGIETVLPGQVLGREGGLATVQVGPHVLTVLEPSPAGDAVFVCLRAEDVTLGPAEAPHTSARNRLPCTVVSLLPEGPLVRVALDAGVALVARVTRLSSEELGLTEGQRVCATFKAPAVRLVPRP